LSQLLTYAIPGLPYGCVFALVAIGLVLTYQTSGVFNLAFGAQAYVSAVIFYVTVVDHHWSKWAAFVLAVLVVGPLIGLILDRLLFRHMRAASVAVKLAVAIGLSIGIPSIVDWVLINKWPIIGRLSSNGERLRPPGIAPNPDHVYHLSSYHFDGTELFTVVVTVGLVVGLGLMFRYSSIGLRMRAVVESPRMVELAGVNSERVSGFAWVLSSLVAALAGVMLAPLYGNVAVDNFNVVLVAAIAAAAIGGMASLPMTLVGGLVLGVGQQILAGYLPLNSIFATGLRPSFPFLVLVAVLLVSPAVRRGKAVADPLAGVDPPPPALAASLRDASLDRLAKIGFPLFIAAFLFVSLFMLSNHYLGLVTDALIYSVIFLSITVVTGMSGQISLCQMTFAGFGAFTAGQLANQQGLPFLVGMLAGAAVAAGVGVLVALPALRLSGLYLALATLAFAIMADSFLFPLKWIGGGAQGIGVPRPVMAGINFSSNRSFFLLCFCILVICSFVVILVRKGTIGTFLAAMRGSEVAAASIGINRARAKITVFALSAAIAGIGGALLAASTNHADAQTFTYQYSLVFVVLVLTTGSRTVEGAINASVGFVAIPEILSHFGNLAVLDFALFGFGTIQYAKHPEGIVEFQKRASMERINRWREQRRVRQARKRGEAVPIPAGPPSVAAEKAH
jgi:ABC-type branched-subunit amino acid transport system permease subunit